MPQHKNRLTNLKPLGVTCTSSDCANELHCFKKSRSMSESERGHCRSCGADLIDWQRVQKRDLQDVEFTFEALKYEMVRHYFWHKPIDQTAENHARRKGRAKLQEAVRRRLEKSVGPAKPPFDGRQTPNEGNIIYYAQLALACCCRTCMNYWYGLPKDVPLSVEQIDYFVELAMMYIDERIPDLTETGERIPPIRHARIVVD